MARRWTWTEGRRGPEKRSAGRRSLAQARLTQRNQVIGLETLLFHVSSVFFLLLLFLKENRCFNSDLGSNRRTWGETLFFSGEAKQQQASIPRTKPTTRILSLVKCKNV